MTFSQTELIAILHHLLFEVRQLRYSKTPLRPLLILLIFSKVRIWIIFYYVWKRVSTFLTLIYIKFPLWWIRTFVFHKLLIFYLFFFRTKIICKKVFIQCIFFLFFEFWSSCHFRCLKKWCCLPIKALIFFIWLFLFLSLKNLSNFVFLFFSIRMLWIFNNA